MEIANRSIFSFPSASLLSLTAGKAALSRCSGPPPHATSCLLAPTRHAALPRRPPFFALELPSLATPPRTAQRPPPRRRGGELAAEPQASNSRAQQHQEGPFTLSRMLSLQFPDPNPRTAPPSAQTPASLTSSSNPLLHPFSPSINPANRSASPSRTFPTTSRRPISTGATSPLSSLHCRPPARYSPPRPRYQAFTGAHGCGEPPTPLHPRRR